MNTELSRMVELTDYELDFVAAGKQQGLVNVNVQDNEIVKNVLNNNNVDVEVNVLSKNR
jgi:hypothetical protein